MATETVVTDHTSNEQQYVKQEKDEAIAEKINSLANEDEKDKQEDKPEDAQDQATPLPKTEGDELKAELAAAEIEKTGDDSPEGSAEDSQKHDSVDDVQSPIEKEGEDEKAEPSVEVEKTDNSVPSEAVVADADTLNEEKEVIPESQTINVTELVEETPQNLEIESIKTDEEKQPETEDIPEAETIENSVETTEKSTNAAETTLAESEAEVVKQEEVLETNQTEEKVEPEPEPVATEVQEKTEEPEKEAQEKSEEADQPSTVAITELSAEANERQSDATEKKTIAEILKEIDNDEVEPTVTGKEEPVVTEVETTETGKAELVATEVQPTETVKEETEKEHVVTEVETTETVIAEPVVTEVETTEAVAEPVVTEVETTETVIVEPVVTQAETTEAVAEPVVTEVETTETVIVEPVVTQAETTEAVAEPVVTEVETTETGIVEPVVTEVETTEAVIAEPVVTEVETTETVIAEPVVIEAEEKQKEPEKHSAEQREEEQPNTSVIPEHSSETSDVIAVEEKTREPEIEAEVLKETNNYESKPTETEKAEPVVTEADDIQSEPEKQSLKQEVEEEPKTVTPETVDEVQEKPGEIVEVHPPKDSDIEVVKEAGNSESESLLVKEEKPEPLSTQVEEKPIDELQVSEDVKNEQETHKSEGKINKEEETNTILNIAPVSLNEETEATPANLVDPSPEVEKKVVEEDGKKESSLADVIEGESSKEVAGVTENLEQDSVDQETKAVQIEERENSVPTGVEEKTVVAANNDKQEPEATDAIKKEEPEAAVQVSSRDVEVNEIKKTEAQNEAKTATTEADSVEEKGVENDIPADDNKKEVDTETKVDEISKAVSEPLTVRETLASKFEEKEEELNETGVDNLENKQVEEPAKTEVEATKENDTTKDLPKETPAKPAQKQSNNIIAKVKQSLVKAKKAITGKSPSSKNLSSDAKGDIKVK